MKQVLPRLTRPPPIFRTSGQAWSRPAQSRFAEYALGGMNALSSSKGLGLGLAVVVVVVAAAPILEPAAAAVLEGAVGRRREETRV